MPFSCKDVLGGLELAGKVELLQDEFDVVFDVLDDVGIGFEKLDVAVINIVVLLEVFFYADIKVRLIDYFDVRHILINNVFVNLSDFLSQT